MDETDLLITQLGLLLTQTRFARRALEDIERATSTYGTYAFTSVIAAGPRFGEPPMLDGALRVHVVNIADLAPGGGFGDFLKGLLGGIGSFLGNLGGGLVGGTLGGFHLALSIGTLNELAGRVERILKLLGLSTPTTPTAGAATGKGEPGPDPQPALLAQLESIRVSVDKVAGLFSAVATTPAPVPEGAAGERQQRMLDSGAVVLQAIARIVDGLIIAIPLAIGAIAWLITRLGDFKIAIAELLRFALRNALLLRGAVLVVAFDTLAMLARTSSLVLGILSDTLNRMLSAIFDTLKEGLLAVFTLGAVLGEALKTTIDRLLNWLVPTVDKILRDIGDLRVFRVLTHVVRILPAILPPIIQLKTDTPLPQQQLDALADASRIAIPDPVGGGAGSGPPAVVPPTLDLKGVFTDPALLGRATAALDRLKQVTSDGLQITGGVAQSGLRAIGSNLERAALEQGKQSETTLAPLLKQVEERSTSLANKLVIPERADSGTGMERIANAYEGWLTSGGLNTLLKTIDAHFTNPQNAGGLVGRFPPGGDPPRAVIQIDEVLIEVGPAPAPPPVPDPAHEPGDYPLMPGLSDGERLARAGFDNALRGATVTRPYRAVTDAGRIG
jgi:hypothetical protein